MIKNVLFRFDVDSGEIAGTGHFMRCISIYNFLKKNYKNKFNYFFLFNNYNNSKKIVKKYVNKNLIIYKKDFLSKISFFKSGDLIINDTPKKIDTAFLNYCKLNGFRNLILIDHDKINYSYKYLLINGIFYLKKKIKNASNIYQGFKYILLNREYASIKKKKTNLLKILITTGGTDNKNVLYKIYRAIENITDIKIYIVIGPGFKKNNPILNIKKKNVFLIKDKKNLKLYFEKTNVSITAGGISMFESICAKNITLVTELYKNQKNSIKELKKLDMISLIGENKYINSSKLVKIISNLKKVKKIKYPKNFRLIDGKSMHRIEKILFKAINKNIY